MADRKASKSTGETPAQQRALGKSIFKVIKQNMTAAAKSKSKRPETPERSVTLAVNKGRREATARASRKR